MFITYISGLETDIKNTNTYQENSLNTSCKAIDIDTEYLIAEKDYAIDNKPLSTSYNILGTTNNDYINTFNQPVAISQSKKCIEAIQSAQTVLETTMLSNDKSVVKKTIELLRHNAEYPNLLTDMLYHYLTQNKISTVQQLAIDYDFYNKTTLNILLQKQLSGEQDTSLIKQLVSKGASLSIDYIESLLQLEDNNLIRKHLKTLYKCDILYTILNYALDKDILDIIEKIYFNGYATLKTLNYLLEKLFSNEFNIKSFNNLIKEGAKVTESSLTKLLNSTDTDKIKNVLNLLTDHELYNTVLTAMLSHALNQDQTEIVRFFYLEYNFFTAYSLNYLLLNDITNTTNIAFINGLLAKGAIIEKNKLVELLNDYFELTPIKSFIDLYTQLHHANFNPETKESIKTLLQALLQKNIGITIEGSNLNIIETLYFDYSIISQSTFDYIQAYEADPKIRHSAELEFEKSHKYMHSLYNIVSNL
jgi:hypothetical protein